METRWSLSYAFRLFVFALLCLSACSSAMMGTPGHTTAPDESNTVPHIGEHHAEEHPPETEPNTPEPSPAELLEAAAAEHCGGKTGRDKELCEIHAPIDYGPVPTLQNKTEAEFIEEGISYSQKIFGGLGARMEKAAEVGETLVDDLLPELDLNALRYVRALQLLMHQRLVVTATSINVRRRPGELNKRPIDVLHQGEVVWFCGGYPGGTKPDDVEVPWYWIDRAGKCDRSEPKHWIASQEVRDGNHHWLVRWHDYDLRYTKHQRRSARDEGRTPDVQRLGGRYWKQLSLDVDPLAIADRIELKVLDHFLSCAFGVAPSAISGRLIRNFFITAAGGVTEAAITNFLFSGLASVPGTVLTSPLAYKFDRDLPVEVALATVFAGAMVALLVRPQAIGLLIGIGVCVGGRMLYDVLDEWLTTHPDPVKKQPES